MTANVKNKSRIMKEALTVKVTLVTGRIEHASDIMKTRMADKIDQN